QFDLRHRPAGLRPATGGADQVEASVRRNAIQPGTQRRASLEPAEPLPRREQRVLQRVLRVVNRTEHPVAVRVELLTVRVGQFAERLAIARPRPLDELCRHVATLPRCLPPRSVARTDTAATQNWAVHRAQLQQSAVSVSPTT